jgi:hypothetical protein
MSDQSPDAVDAAFRQLHVNITRAVAFATDPEICSGPDAITPLERKREIAALLIQFAVQFLAATADKGWAKEYFFEVASALRQLNEGIVSPLLAPSSSKGRARQPSCLWVARARVVVAFRKANLSPKDAVANHPSIWTSGQRSASARHRIHWQPDCRGLGGQTQRHGGYDERPASVIEFGSTSSFLVPRVLRRGADRAARIDSPRRGCLPQTDTFVRL